MKEQEMVNLIDELRSSFEELKQTRGELLPRLQFYDPEVRDLRERLENLWKRLRRRMRRLVPVAEAKVSADVEEAKLLQEELRDRYEELRQFLDAPERPIGGSRRPSHRSSRSSGHRPLASEDPEPRGHSGDRGGAWWSS